MQPHHSPLSNTYVLLSIFGMIVAAAIWSLSPSWGFLILLFSIITFIASFISAVRAPLKSDEEIELAVHERYHGRRYPDTDLHHGHVPAQKKYLHSRHKKHLVKHHISSSEEAKKTKKSSKRKASTRKTAKRSASKKKTPSKKSTRKAASKKSSKRAAKKTSKRTSKKSSRRKR